MEWKRWWRRHSLVETKGPKREGKWGCNTTSPFTIGTGVPIRNNGPSYTQGRGPFWTSSGVFLTRLFTNIYKFSREPWYTGPFHRVIRTWKLTPRKGIDDPRKVWQTLTVLNTIVKDLLPFRCEGDISQFWRPSAHYMKVNFYINYNRPKYL